MEPKVSVVVPIYNVQPYLERCLKSLQNQSFHDFEVILVNDGSTDNSEKICCKFVKDDKRFRYFKKVNGGLSDARNFGVNQARGKYIIFTDSDDFVEKDYIKILYDHAINDNAEIVVCAFFETDEKGAKLRRITIDNKNFILTGRDLIKNYYIKNNSIANIVAWNKIYLADIFKTVRFEKGRFFEDEYIFVPLFWNVKRVSIVNIPLYNYVQRSGSIMKTKFSEKKFYDNLKFRKQRVAFFKDEKSYFQNYAIQDFKNYLINLTRDKKKQEVLTAENWKEIQKLYRNLVKMKQGVGLKNKIKDILGFVNLKIL